MAETLDQFNRAPSQAIKDLPSISPGACQIHADGSAAALSALRSSSQSTHSTA